MVRVPDTIGLSETDAEAKARAAGLNWTIRWKESATHEPGIYDQEPQPGEVVKTGDRFTMFAYRPSD
jgi:beta-lactam-binding protein with PASTA domain